MRRHLSRALRFAARALASLIGAIRPQPGTTEGAVMAGIALIGTAFLAAAILTPALAGLLVPLAIGVPGLLVLAVGLGFDLRRTR